MALRRKGGVRKKTRRVRRVNGRRTGRTLGRRVGRRIPMVRGRGTKRRMGSMAGRATKRARVGARQVGPQGGDFSMLTVRSRRPKPVSFRIAKALTVDYRILRFQRTSRQNGTVLSVDTPVEGTFPGKCALHNQLSSGVAQQYPIHILDLTSTLNTVSPNASVFYEVRTTASTGILSYSSTPGQQSTGADATGANAAAWQLEYGDNVSTSLKKQFISPRWYDIRLMCYGARNQPTLYEILVVRFSKEHLVPALDGFSASQPETIDEYHGFWQGMAKRLTFNSIQPAQNRYGAVSNGMRVVKKVSFLLPASNTTDADITPPSKAVKLFVPDGRLLNYRSPTDSYAGSTAGKFSTDNSWLVVNPTSATEYDVPIKETDRTFLIVRAVNTTNTQVAGTGPIPATWLNTPSYDIVVRKKEAYDAH